MMRNLLQNTLLALAGLVAASASAADSRIDLRVTRVALFNSGVGYFECTGTVEGRAVAELRFRSDQINDILKSLVVQDLGGGSVGVVQYASQDPIDRTLKSFAVDLTGEPALADLLKQLRGEPAEVAGARSLTGTIVGVEEHQVLGPDGETLQTVQRLNLLTDSGLQQVDLATVTGIRLLNDKIDAELRKALATLASAHDADKKTVRLEFDGVGKRPVRVAYLLETPIWKTSYRLDLTDEQHPFLQGWATVENATEEDWNEVRLSLVSGRPISFRMDLYTPIYIPRPLEQLELYTSLRPPEYEGGVAFAELAKARAPADAAPAEDKLRNMAESARGRLFAAGKAGPSYGFSLADRGVASVASAQEAGELFEYEIRAPVTLPRQHSALLPIVNEPVTATKMSIYNPRTHEKYPLNGLELINSTDLHLMQGPVTVFDDGIYAGDAKLPDLRPGEKRLVAYALDLATEVFVERKPVPEELVSLRIAKGTLWHRRKYVDRREYTIRNKADRERILILEQACPQDWKLVEPAEAYERTSDLLRFRLTVRAGETVRYPVRLERVADQSLVLTSAGLDDIRLYLRAAVITPAVRQALEKVVALRTELDALSRQRQEQERALREVLDDQARVRENLRSLDQSSDSYARQLKKFDELETRIEQARERIDVARRNEEQKRSELERFLLSLNVE